MKRAHYVVLASLLTAVAIGCGGTQSTSPAQPLAGAQAQTPAAASAPAAAPAGPPKKVTEVGGITEYQLDNGLKVLLFPDPSKETVTVNVTYFVGSRHEGYGEAGMAHLLEHMVFKGTPEYPELWKALKDHGASFNGTTWVDRTNYYETLPATDENLEFALSMEASRMVDSTIAQEELDKEFSVVRNEFEMGENDPSGVLMERMASTAYLWHNYGKSTIGNKSDIEKVPASRLRKFYEKYYQPDNAMLVVAGRFEPEQALALINREFGSIPRPTRELEPTYTQEPVQDGEREVILRRVGDVGVVGVMYHGVPGAHEQFQSLEAAAQILTDEPSGRLYEALVEPGLATSVGGFAFPFREPGSVIFMAQVPPGKPLEPVRDKMVQVIEGLGATDITKEEVDRFVNRRKKQMDLDFTNSQSIAVELSEWAAMGDWRLIFVYRDRLSALDPARVQAAADAYFRRPNRTVGMFVPAKKIADRAPLPERPDVEALVAGYTSERGVAEGEAFAATYDNIEARTERLALPNGAKVALLAKETRGDAVVAQIHLRYGNAKALASSDAAASLLPEMLMRGTKKRSYQQIRDELDRLKASVSFGGGGGLSFSADPGTLTINVKTVRDNLDEVLALVAEILQEPTFPADQFKIVQKEQITALEESQSDPMQRGFTTFFRTLMPYPKNDVRYIKDAKESIAALQKVRAADLAKLHKAHLGASSAQIAIVGDFDAAATKKVLSERFGGWKNASAYERVPTPYLANKAGIQVVNTPDKKMAMIVAGHTLQLRDDQPQYPAMLMAGYILGGNAASRLLERLRQQDGLSYTTFGAVQAGSQDDLGALFAMAILAPQNADKAMNAMLEEIRKLRTEGVTAEELEEAKQAYAKQITNKLSNDGAVAAALSQGLYLDRTMAFDKQLLAQIMALTPADLKKALEAIDMDRLSKLKAGDLGDAE